MITANKIAAATQQPEWVRSHNFARGANQATATNAPVPHAARAEATAALEDTKAVSASDATNNVRPVGKINRDHLPQNVVAMTFKDVIDTLNPLQHLPGVGDLYRAVTGDEPSGMARVLGGFAFGGFGGGIMAFADTTHEQSHNGQGLAETMVATILGDENPAASPTMLANAAPEKPMTVATAVPTQPHAQPVTTASKPLPTTAFQAARQQPTDYLPALPPKNMVNKLDDASMSMLLQEKVRGNVGEDVKQLEGLAEIAANARIGNVGSAAATEKNIPELMNSALDKYRRNATQRATSLPAYVPPLQRF